ncbi:rhomboid family intramembrane serine protease [Corynebacterium striatum]|uniref:rhomboid family intramembrane serine protease n=1 Tax=Corynebacterium striatum TaxID=43770 RepID=UPI00234D8213|nr:rhomboid family intramembrane serine protease [Corynebacterium striatum]MDC7106820.1 rhomboid family intramembrane serine protease [Corynebacterium striatum]
MTSGGTSGYSFPNSAFGANQPHGASSPVRPNRGDSKNYTRGGRIRTGISLAVGFLVVEWLVQITNFLIFGGALSNYGIRPLDFNGIWGIFTAPLLHANFEHLIGNSVPGAIFCFLIGLSGRKAWWEVTIITVLVAGIGTWLLGGPGTSHIGASSLVYGWLAYLIVRGLFNRSFSQTALGVVLGFAYSGLVWGVLPVYEGVSWQGHLFGAIGGVIAGMIITSDDPVKVAKR